MSTRKIPYEAVEDWFNEQKRDLPWRETDDPYAVWVSEIMLQQTQVETVKDYYNDFLDRFPTVYDLADATQDEVLKAWEGMGFYARARRLHKAAKIVVQEHNGSLPEKRSELLDLPGIGEYTASAIQSFVFGEDHPVIDSNVQRVLARWNKIDNPLNRKDTEARMRDVLKESLEESEQPDVLSEGLIELGALVCKPNQPICERCPVHNTCLSYRDGIQEELPVKKEKSEVEHHEIGVGVVFDQGNVLISRRPDDAMLGGLWEFPGGKQENDETLVETVQRELQEELGINVSVGDKIKSVPHQYSHMSITLHAYWCSLRGGKPRGKEGQQWRWVPIDNLSEYAFPKANKTVLEAVQKRHHAEFSR